MTTRILCSVFLWLAGVFALVGCVPVDVYHQTGVPVARQETDLVQCEAHGARDVPVSVQTHTAPIIVTPTRTTCVQNNGVSECTVTGGEVRGGEVETFDANSPLRGRVVAQCMIAKGYRALTLDECTKKQLRGQSLNARAISPLAVDACVTKAKGGGWIFVNP